MTHDSAAAFRRIYGATRTDSYASEAVPRRTGSSRSHLTDQRVARSATPGLMAVDQKSGGKSSSRCELCLADVANKDHDGYADKTLLVGLTSVHSLQDVRMRLRPCATAEAALLAPP